MFPNSKQSKRKAEEALDKRQIDPLECSETISKTQLEIISPEILFLSTSLLKEAPFFQSDFGNWDQVKINSLKSAKIKLN
jgi:hypothetical protein